MPTTTVTPLSDYSDFLVSGDPIYLHSRLATQEMTNTSVKLHDDISKASRIPWVENLHEREEK